MKYTNILIVTAVDAEKDAVLRGLNGNQHFTVVAGGVGPILSAVHTTKALTNNEFDLVISAGIAGGFPSQAEVGSVVVGTNLIAAELGAETDEGFLEIEQLGFGCSKLPTNKQLVNKVVTHLQKNSLSVHQGAIVTVCTVTGSTKKMNEFIDRVPNVIAEAMEGFGVATAANVAEKPFLELRTISNPVGPRDRDNWKIKEALITLEKVSSLLPEVLL